MRALRTTPTTTMPIGCQTQTASATMTDESDVPAPVPSRSIPRWLAGVVQALELDQQRLVTVADVLHARPDLDP